MLEKCQILKEYTFFVESVRRQKGNKHAIKEAINECIDNGILVEYLKRKGSEVRNMLVAEYDYEKDIFVKQEEAKEEGREEGRDYSNSYDKDGKKFYCRNCNVFWTYRR